MTVSETVMTAGSLLGAGLMTLWGAWMFATAFPLLARRGRLWLGVLLLGAMIGAGAMAILVALDMIWQVPGCPTLGV